MVQFPTPTGIELCRYAQSAAGAAGCDGWCGQELRFWPLPVWQLVSQLISEAIDRNQIPKQFLQARMVCIPKANKISNGLVSPEHCRPLTIMSSIWRLWASCFYKTPAFQRWVRENFSPEIASMKHDDLYVHLITIFRDFQEKGFLLALDYEKAFDTLDPKVTKELLLAHNWDPKLVNFLCNLWGSQERFLCWKYNTHKHFLKGPAQPQGDPLGPLIMSLWVQSGLRFVQSLFPDLDVRSTLYLDDRTITASSAPTLHAHWSAWDDWSRRVGLIESHNKAVCVSSRPKDAAQLSDVFSDQVQVANCARVLGAVSVSGPRKLSSHEESRVAACRRTIRLLSSMGLPLAVFFRTVGQFAMSKASFGWVCRSPPKTVSDKLWTACWVAADRARYSSPFVRSILFGGVYLDALWAARLVTALLRYSLRFQGCPPWSLRFGSPCATLNTWLLRCHWVRVRPWVWQHPLGGVKLDLSVPLSPQLVDGWINHCRHVLRVGWRAYQFKEWCASSRHELLEIPSPLNWFQKINWGDARDWATTTASAATVCLGAHWQHKDPSRAGCIWPGCSSLGHFHHVFWECASRPHFAPARPASPFLARFGWSAGEDPQIVQSVRVWLSFVQSQLWKVQYG